MTISPVIFSNAIKNYMLFFVLLIKFFDINIKLIL